MPAAAAASTPPCNSVTHAGSVQQQAIDTLFAALCAAAADALRQAQMKYVSDFQARRESAVAAMVIIYCSSHCGTFVVACFVHVRALPYKKKVLQQTVFLNMLETAKVLCSGFSPRSTTCQAVTQWLCCWHGKPSSMTNWRVATDLSGQSAGSFRNK
jgi:hypothetical protein